VTVTTYAQWVAAGSPWKPAAPIDNLSRVLGGYGYTVYVLGDENHATADPPEDHMPYSHTPWPGAQPYDYVLACDIMPPPAGKGLPDLVALGAQLIADKNAGVAPWIKYLNWTDGDGNCWHESWQPNHTRTGSNDRGHLHVSIRTDYATKVVNYDPVASIRGEDMAFTDEEKNKLLQQSEANTERLNALCEGLASIVTSWSNKNPTGTQDIWIVQQIQTLVEKVGAFTGAEQDKVDAATADALRAGADAIDPTK
jgi:hypothetical protein